MDSLAEGTGWNLFPMTSGRSSGRLILDGFRRAIVVAVCSTGMIVAHVQAQVVGDDADSTGSRQAALESFVSEAPNQTYVALERAEAFVRSGEVEDCLEILQSLLSSPESMLVPRDFPAQTSPIVWVPVRDYVQALLVEWSGQHPELLRGYRRRYDPVVRRMLAEVGTRQSGEERLRVLREVIDRYFPAAGIEQALWAASELYLEQGAFESSRACCEELAAGLRLNGELAGRLGFAPLTPCWQAAARLEQLPGDQEANWQRLVEAVRRPRPDRGQRYVVEPQLPLADVLARMVWTSILEGDLPRAESELRLLQRLAPESPGRLGNLEGRWAQLLEDPLAASRSWPPPPRTPWATFAGGHARHGRLPVELDPQLQPLWRMEWPARAATDEWVAAGRTRVAEAADAALVRVPLVLDEQVIVAGDRLLQSYDLRSGQELWSRVWSDRGSIQSREDRGPQQGIMRGVPRYTLSAEGTGVYSRFGRAWLPYPPDERILQPQRSFLVGMDVRTQRQTLARVYPPERWEFAGTPLVVDQVGYAVIVRIENGVSEMAVVALDAGSGRWLWQTPVGRGQVDGGASLYTASNQLLTLEGESLFLNTQMGLVACLDRTDGKLSWVHQYPRQTAVRQDPDARPTFGFRELTPCVVDRDEVFVLPSDRDQVLALDRRTGVLRWASAAGGAAVHLLAVTDRHLIVSGDSVMWLDRASGKRTGHFPSRIGRRPGLGLSGPLGRGRGLVSSSRVYWPTRDAIFVLDIQTGRPVRQPIDLRPYRVTGGHLIWSPGYLLLASGRELVCLGNRE